MDVRTQKIEYIDLHHTAGNEANTEAVRQEHLARGFDDIGYNWVIEKDGTVGKGRDPYYAGAHDPGMAPNGVASMNQCSLGVSHIGNFMLEDMLEVQFQASTTKVAELCKEYGIQPTKDWIRRHKDQFATDCPGDRFPYDRYIEVLAQKMNTTQEEASTPAPAPVVIPFIPAVENFSYPNNAKVVGDDLYIRDENGQRLQGHYVSNGDLITVLDVSYSKQLALVEYPTDAGVRTGYVRNLSDFIAYDNQDQWLNGSTPEPVYDAQGAVIGWLNSGEYATPIYRRNHKLHVVYSTDKGRNTKSGFVAWDGGFSKF